MALSKNLGMYTDCARVLNKVTELGSGTVVFPTKSAAVRFRLRCYYYRGLLHKRQAEMLGSETAQTSTPYDDIIIRWKDDKPLELTFQQQALHAKFIGPDGQEHAMDNVSSEAPQDEMLGLDFDEIEKQANEFAKGFK